MMTYALAIKLAKDYPLSIRAMRYKTWRERKLLREAEIAAVEAMYPAEDGVEPKPPPPKPAPAKEGPTIAEMAANFTVAMAEWVKAGLPVVDEAVFQLRLAMCRACEFWDEQARLGLGKCNHKKCGCTRFKLFVGTERCPDGRWK